MTRFAAIDVGSNAMRLRIVEASSAEDVREVASERAAVRLGREVFQSGRLNARAIADAVKALQGFAEKMRAERVDAYRAVATSAVRDAANGSLLTERALREAGIKLEVVDGMEEARLARLAVVHAVEIRGRRALLVDVGGGSVELTSMVGDNVKATASLPLGTVRLCEAFLDREGVVTQQQRDLLREYIRRLLGEAPWARKIQPDVVVATGGNLETIATLAPIRTPDGPGIAVPRMRSLCAEMCALPARERRERWNLRADRVDVIIPALHVMEAVADATGVETLAAPGVGLKDGILAELISRNFRVWDSGGEARALEAEALALGRRYGLDEGHAMHVTSLASSLFDQLQTVHGLGADERAWLRLAAILHDVGDYIGYDAHHKHSYYLVMQSSLMGITPEVRRIVANVVRYHRKATPDLSHPGFRKLDRKGREVVRKLSAVLRVADALDREHLSRVREVAVKVERSRVTLRARGDGDLSLSLWTLSRKGDAFKEAFDRELKVEGAEGFAVQPARRGR